MFRPAFRITFALTAIGLLSAGSALAQPTSPGAPEDIDQMEAALTLVDGGDHLLAWSQEISATGQIRIKHLENGVNDLARSKHLGQPFGRSGIPGWQAGDQRSPAFGPGFLVWAEKRPGGADFDLYAQRHGLAGTAVGNPILELERPGDQIRPAVAADRSGELMLVWSEFGATNGMDIWGLRLSNALMPRGAPFAIAAGASNAGDPTIAADPSSGDGFLVVWVDDRAGAGEADLYGVTVHRSGVLKRPGATAEMALVVGPGHSLAPSLTVDAASTDEVNGLLAWQMVPPAGSTMSIHIQAQRLRSNGLFYGRPFAVRPSLFFDLMPAVAPRQPEGWLAVWSRSGNFMPPSPVLNGFQEDPSGVWVPVTPDSLGPMQAMQATPAPTATAAVPTPVPDSLDLWGVTIDRNARVGRPARPVAED